MGGAGRRPLKPQKQRTRKVERSLDEEVTALNDWWEARLNQMALEHQARIELLRSVGEHPSPLFAKQVRKYGALGVSKLVVSQMLEVPLVTIEIHYAQDYELGTQEVISAVAANMIRIACSTTDPAASRVGMDLLSRRGGTAWMPPAMKLKVTDERETTANLIDSSKLSADERDQLRTMIKRITTGAPVLEVLPAEVEDDGA